MKQNRRKFIKRLLLAIGAVEGFFLVKNGIHKSHLTNIDHQWLNAGKVVNFERNNIYPFSTGKFFLSRFEDGGFLAISVKCTHLGCIVNINPESKGYDCPCHASRFNKFGEVLSAPATRPLDILPIKIENGELLIDASKPVKRKKFRKSQLTYA
jgi:Rieske Fe-S protein